MSEKAPSPILPATAHDPGDPLRRKHFVHVYAVVRVKVEVDAEDHHSAMVATDICLIGNGFGVSFVPRVHSVIEAEYAEEVVGYLVDEADDPDYERSRNYGPNHEPQMPDGRHRNTQPVAPGDRRVTLTFVAQAWSNDEAIEVDAPEANWDANVQIKDELRYEGDAPQWVRDWPGPFEVRLDDDVADVWSGSDEQ